MFILEKKKRFKNNYLSFQLKNLKKKKKFKPKKKGNTKAQWDTEELGKWINIEYEQNQK